MSQRQSAGRLFRLHVALGALGVALVAGATGFIAAGLDLSLPSPGSVAAACDRWISATGAGAAVVLALSALAVASLVLGLRSVARQLRASRRYLERMPVLARTTTVEGADVRLIDTPAPLAFCAGYLHPNVYLTRGALEELSNEELRAVVTHELHHLGRRDPLRLLLARSLADALFFLPLLRRSSERYAALGELAADEAALRRLGDRGALAAALLKFSAPEDRPEAVVGIAPERVDHLVGDADAGSWQLPVSLVGPSAAALVGLAALLSALAHGLVSAKVDLPVLLSAGCMVAMLGGPIALALGAVVISRRTVRARRA